MKIYVLPSQKSATRDNVISDIENNGFTVLQTTKIEKIEAAIQAQILSSDVILLMTNSPISSYLLAGWIAGMGMPLYAFWDNENPVVPALFDIASHVFNSYEELTTSLALYQNHLNENQP